LFYQLGRKPCVAQHGIKDHWREGVKYHQKLQVELPVLKYFDVKADKTLFSHYPSPIPCNPRQKSYN